MYFTVWWFILLETVAQYTNRQLAAGVNLAEAALKAGPVADQVQAIWNAIKDKRLPAEKWTSLRTLQISCPPSRAAVDIPGWRR